MGYTTDFKGEFTLDKPLEYKHAFYLREFSRTRRMRRSEKIAAKLLDPVREAVGLPVGKEGCYFVGGGGFAGQDSDASILDYNDAPGRIWDKKTYEDTVKPWAQPGLWCQWVPTEDGTGIEWNGAEKFYAYVEWLEYIVEHFLKPWGYKLSGEVEWQGEDAADTGFIVAEKNEVWTEEVKRVRKRKKRK